MAVGQLLKDEATEEKGKGARMVSFVGAMGIADLVKTTLGPKGMGFKMIGSLITRMLVILVDGLTVGERIGDVFIDWVPMYGEAKLAFLIYLWFPKTKGTTYVYDSFFRPYVAKHEPEIDRNLIELRTRAGDMVILYWQRAASYGQTIEIMHYIASQSSPSKPPQETRYPRNQLN